LQQSWRNKKGDRVKNKGSVVLRDLSQDYPEAQAYIENMFRENRVSRTMIAETMLVFEALCFKVFDQRENPDSEVTVSGFRRTGDSSIEVTFVGGRFDPDPEDPSFLTPEDSILKAYADKIDYSYRTGFNKITITAKRNHMVSVALYAASIILGIAFYTLLHFTASEEVQLMVANKFVFPMERLFLNAVLMVAAPVTFLSMLKHLTDTYIIAESNSNAVRLHRNTISSSVISVVLAVVTGWILVQLLFVGGPFSGKYPRGEVDLDPETLIPSLLPSDIFAPFQTVMPYSLIILAVLTTYAFCSVGKYFDRMKDTIDIAYVLFARMLEVVMYGLPVAAFCSVLDELFSDGYGTIVVMLELIVVAFASLIVLFVYYILRLLKSGIQPVPFFRKMMPLLRENAAIASAFDAVPYNIRYCARVYGFDRKRLERTLPVLAQINLDGNCFLITVIAMIYIAANSTPLSLRDALVIGLLVLLLSLGAPNQPGSCMIGLTIVMVFLKAEDLLTVALYAEVFFGGILNLTNIVGDMVTAAIEEVGECGGADDLNAHTAA
jgi:Na+/H+-dicarboxylate symporter